jgi:N-acetylated-alpha-linked acidic dipeptidase
MRPESRARRTAKRPILTILTILTILLLASVAVTTASGGEDPPLLGFGDEAAGGQRRLERRFDELLDAEEIGGWIERLSARPHHVGSPYGKQNAELMVELLRSWGWEAELAPYRVLFPTPRTRLLELLEPTRFTASLVEPVLAEDATSAQVDEQLPVYNAYSIDGDVTGELVYVNYGIPDDYLELEKRGVSVEGKIVIARYYGSWRGIKPKVAAERGAIGCILYSDPADDGYRQGDVYPAGGWRPPFGAQRGSVADMPLYPGDPATPFVGATEDAEPLPLDRIETLTDIPVLPISYRDAQPLLEALGGPLAPETWRGGLPIAYHIGPGPARVRLKLEFDWDRVTAYNVVATLRGAELPDQWILRGNHHDAWVNGATDPVSGMAAVLAEAKALGALHAEGWRPRRTLVYAGWDAEEPGLLGSTEWAEHHAEELSRKAVAYINSDSNSRGFLYAGGSHTLERFFNQVARDVDDPLTEGSVADRQRARISVYGPEPLREATAGFGDVPLEPLGSGSDYTPFLQHLGIASLNIGFGGEDQYGQYHSIYDSFDHYRRFMDPTFEYGVALARVGGRAVMRLADAEVLPFEFTRLASTVSRYVDEIETAVDEMREATLAENERITSGAYAAAWDPRDGWKVPEPKQPVPHLNFAPLRNALIRLEASAARYEEVRESGSGSGAELDRLLLGTERALTREQGLPGRPWFRHHVYAPGFYTGYGVKTLPGVREAVEQRRWDEATEQIEIAAAVLVKAADQIDRAAAARGE